MALVKVKTAQVNHKYQISSHGFFSQLSLSFHENFFWIKFSHFRLLGVFCVVVFFVSFFFLISTILMKDPGGCRFLGLNIHMYHVSFNIQTLFRLSRPASCDKVGQIWPASV